MTVLRYLAIQVIAYGIDMGSFLFTLHLGLGGPIAANIIAKLAAGGFAFAAHRSFTFGVAGNDLIGRQAVRYFLLLAVNVPVASAILAVMLQWISTEAIAKFLSDVVCVAFSYGLSKYFIFNAHASPSDSSLPGAKK
jgi:putative flippase GtrA